MKTKALLALAAVFLMGVLTACGGGGGSSVPTTPPTTVNAPVAAFSTNVTAGVAPLSLTCTDTSTRSPTAWAWDFGDGTTSTVQSPSHTYATAGTYTVTLTAFNAEGNSSAHTVIVVSTTPVQTPVPTASFTTSATSGLAPLAVTFTDTSTGSPTSWLWSFGDGATSTFQNPLHLYTTPGTYTASLTAVNAGGSNAKSVTITVTAPLIASFTTSVTSGTSPLSVTFTDTSTGSPTSWLWDFGDGTTSTERNPTHVYRNLYQIGSNAFTATLTVSNAGGSNAKLATITVNPSPLWRVGGTVWASTTDGTNLFVTWRPVDNVGEVHLTKFKTDGTVDWDQTVLTNSGGIVESQGIASMGGYIYLLCGTTTSDGGNQTTWFERFNTTTGAKVAERSYADKYPAGINYNLLTADPSQGLLYAWYYEHSSRTGFTILLDQAGTIVNSVSDHATEALNQGIVVGSDGIYAIGWNIQSSYRVHVVKFSRDLTTRLWEFQYRNFSDSGDIDQPYGSVLSPDGKLLVGANIGFTFPPAGAPASSADFGYGVLLKIDPASGALIDDSLRSDTFASIGQLFFDSSGYLYSIGRDVISKFNPATVTFVWQNTGIVSSSGFDVLIGSTLFVSVPVYSMMPIDTATGGRLN